MSFRDSCYYLSGPKIDGPAKVIGLDLDWTIIRPAHSLHGVKEEDWMLLPYRIHALQYLVANGYQIVIFTNQKYKGKALAKRLIILRQVHACLASQGIPTWFLAATKEDAYRKPMTAMWSLYCELSGAGPTNIDPSQSYYAGDAAGRPQDFSASDKLFADAIGLQFLTPEEMFPQPELVIPTTQTMFIFVGMAGSGKSTFYHEKLEPSGWCRAEQDDLKTVKKMLTHVDQCLSQGKSVAADATNPTIEHRARYIQLAIKYQVPTMILHFNINGHGFNKLRGEDKVPDIAYHKYMKIFESPSTDEGVAVFEITDNRHL